jgi:hypothetical protein
MKLLVDEVQLGEIAKPAADAAIRQAIAFLSQTLAPRQPLAAKGGRCPHGPVALSPPLRDNAIRPDRPVQATRPRRLT